MMRITRYADTRHSMAKTAKKEKPAYVTNIS